MRGTWLKIAKTDLKAAKLLYENALYPQAVFYLQQSVEKTVKFLAIFMNLLKESEVRNKVGHEPLKFYEDLFVKQREKLQGITNMLEVTPQLKNIAPFKNTDVRQLYIKTERDLLDLQGLINRDAYFVLSEEVNNDIINSLKKLKLQNEESKQNIQITDEEIDEFKKVFLKNLDILSKIVHQEADQDINNVKMDLTTLDNNLIKIMLQAILVYLPDLYYLIYSLFYLSIVTNPHAISSRYPDEKHNPLEIYTIEYPLIKLFRNYTEITENMIQKLDEYLEVINNQQKSK